MEVNFEKILASMKFWPHRPLHKGDLVFLARDWLYLLIGLFILSLGVFVFAAYTFYKVNYGEFFFSSEESGGSVEVFSRGKLNETIEVFESRRALFEKLKASRPSVAQP